MVTMGNCLSPASPNWSALDYLEAWLLVRMPIFVLVAAVPAALYLSIFGSAADKILVFAAGFPLALIVARNATLYDGMRHVLFVVPPIFAIVFIAFGKLRVERKTKRLGQFGLIGAVVSLCCFAVDNITLFPYNYVYFNEAARNYARPEKFDLDYWGFSLKEATYKLNDQVSVQSEERYNYSAAPAPAHLVAPYADAKLRLVRSQALSAVKDYYQVSFTRGNTRPAANCRAVAKVQRYLVFAGKPLVLSFVARCSDAASVDSSVKSAPF
jgi:hypothetical protein